MINNSTSTAVWIFNTETELWSLVEAKGDIPVSSFILGVNFCQSGKLSCELTELSSGPELRQLEAATQWSEPVLDWYFLAARTQKERNDMTFTCLISNHQHGFHWTISKSFLDFWPLHFWYRSIVVPTLNTPHLSASVFFSNLWLDLIHTLGLLRLCLDQFAFLRGNFQHLKY